MGEFTIFWVKFHPDSVHQKVLKSVQSPSSSKYKTGGAFFETQCIRRWRMQSHSARAFGVRCVTRLCYIAKRCISWAHNVDDRIWASFCSASTPNGVTSTAGSKVAECSLATSETLFQWHPQWRLRPIRPTGLDVVRTVAVHRAAMLGVCLESSKSDLNCG